MTERPALAKIIDNFKHLNYLKIENMTQKNITTELKISSVWATMNVDRRYWQDRAGMVISHCVPTLFERWRRRRSMLHVPSMCKAASNEGGHDSQNANSDCRIPFLDPFQLQDAAEVKSRLAAQFHHWGSTCFHLDHCWITVGLHSSRLEWRPGSLTKLDQVKPSRWGSTEHTEQSFRNPRVGAEHEQKKSQWRLQIVFFPDSDVRVGPEWPR